MMEYNKPIRIFLANLLRIGVTLRVVDGTLRIGGPGRVNLSPVYRDEIVRRAPQLIELLAPSVPQPLQMYMARMLTVTEAEAAQNVANQIEAPIVLTPANGGWLLLMRGF